MANSFRDDLQQSFIPKYGAIAWLIIINVGVYVLLGTAMVLLFVMGNELLFVELYKKLSLPSDPSELFTQPWSAFTYMWVHSLGGRALSSVLHIAFNMLWLFWIGGKIFKQYQPDKRIWFLFVVGALAGGLLYIASYNIFPQFAGQQAYLVGASAGVMAIIVGTATLLPQHTMFLMFLGAVKLVWIVAIILFLDFLSIATSGNAGGMIAHIGGALFGYLYIVGVKSGRDIGEPFFNLFKKKAPKSPLRVATKKKGGKAQSGQYAGQPGKPNQAEVDRILDKIAKVGYTKLTKEEKQILFDASRE